MEAKKLNELLNSFNVQADSVKNSLTDLLVTVSDGRIPNEETLKTFNASINILVLEYEQLKTEAQAVLKAEEMPVAGSKASAYVEAINNSKSRMIKRQVKKLKRF